MIKVSKFGGSSVADAMQFEKVKRIIESDPSRQFVVVSATGKRFKDDNKVTDLLYLCHAHLKYGVSYENIFSLIEERYYAIQKDLKLKTDLQKEFAEIRSKMNRDMSIDYLVSRGEYLTGLLMAEYLGFDFADAASFIIFNYDGSINFEKTQSALEKILEEHTRLVVPGFYGVLPNGMVKVMSRGGSDITGAILANAINADVYENWTDVSGILVADPRIIENPRRIESITYNELRELSYMGASVLHENSIFPIRNEGIPIQIKNTNRPEDEGTLIVETTCHKPDHVITGIAGKKGFATIMIEKDMMNSEIGFGRKVLQVLEDNDLSFEHTPSGIDTMTIVVETESFIDKEQEILAGIHRAVQPDSIELESDLALIAIVGRGMKDGRGTAAKIFTALAQENINIKMIDQGSSELNIIVGVKNIHFKNAIRAIYKMFITEEK